MPIQVIIATVAGILCGIITGLVPGLHVNLVSAVLLSSAAYLLDFFSETALAVFIISIALTHTFLDIIPTVFLGAPNPDTALAVLPGHEFLLKGLGFEAVKLGIIGSLFGVILSIALMPLFILIVPVIYNFVKPFIAYFLIGVAVLLILKEETARQKLVALTLFLASGSLGLLLLKGLVVNQALLPLLSGLFGMSTLLLSLNTEVIVPEQNSVSITLSKARIAKAVLALTLAGWITSMLPAVGAAQATVFASLLFKKMSKSVYLIVVGGVNTVNFLLSLVTFYTINKARNGAIVAVQQLLGEIGLKELLLFVAIALLVSGIAVILALNFARLFAAILPRINYKILCITIILFLVIMVGLISGFLGLAVLFTATAIGIVAPLYQVKRCVLMGCLMLPVIVMLIF